MCYMNVSNITLFYLLGWQYSNGFPLKPGIHSHWGLWSITEHFELRPHGLLTTHGSVKNPTTYVNKMLRKDHFKFILR